MSNPMIDALDELTADGTDAPSREIFGPCGAMSRLVTFSHDYKQRLRADWLVTVERAKSWDALVANQDAVDVAMAADRRNADPTGIKEDAQPQQDFSTWRDQRGPHPPDGARPGYDPEAKDPLSLKIREYNEDLRR